MHSGELRGKSGKSAEFEDGFVSGITHVVQNIIPMLGSPRAVSVEEVLAAGPEVYPAVDFEALKDEYAAAQPASMSKVVFPTDDEADAASEKHVCETGDHQVCTDEALAAARGVEPFSLPEPFDSMMNLDEVAEAFTAASEVESVAASEEGPAAE
jgi:hypothetical protein